MLINVPCEDDNTKDHGEIYARTRQQESFDDNREDINGDSS